MQRKINETAKKNLRRQWNTETVLDREGITTKNRIRLKQLGAVKQFKHEN